MALINYLFSNLLNDSEFSHEELALASKLGVGNVISLSPESSLKILNALLIEKVAKGELIEDIVLVIKMLQSSVDNQKYQERTIRQLHVFQVPILSELGDIISRISTVVTLLLVGCLLFAFSNPKICHDVIGAVMRFNRQCWKIFKYSLIPN